MSEVTISPKAYIKMIFHAGMFNLSSHSFKKQTLHILINFLFLAKYPHLAVNGLLLGKKTSEKSKTEVVDAVPLFHQCLYVSPMSEIALVQVESRAASENLQIVGYYAGAENFYDNSIDKAPGMKIADKIVEISGFASVVMVSFRKYFHDLI